MGIPRQPLEFCWNSSDFVCQPGPSSQNNQSGEDHIRPRTAWGHLWHCAELERHMLEEVKTALGLLGHETQRISVYHCTYSGPIHSTTFKLANFLCHEATTFPHSKITRSLEPPSHAQTMSRHRLRADHAVSNDGFVSDLCRDQRSFQRTWHLKEVGTAIVHHTMMQHIPLCRPPKCAFFGWEGLTVVPTWCVIIVSSNVPVAPSCSEMTTVGQLEHDRMECFHLIIHNVQ
jgi:hypothetical protein